MRYECTGDGPYSSDEMYFSINGGILSIELEEDGWINSIEFTDHEKVKEIARVLVTYLQGET